MEGESTGHTSNNRTIGRRVIGIARSYGAALWKRYKAASPLAKAFIWLFFCANALILSAIAWFGPRLIAQKLWDWSQVLKNMPFGWLILISVITITSFPPLVGWSTTVSVCGFAYGLPGWFVASAGALLGAALSFIVLRLLFRERIQSVTQSNRKWVALENVIRARGLPLIILIRLSPLPPWVYANLLFSSIETVSFFQFMIATVFYTPKLMIAVWIGSRVAMFSDGSQRDKMDTPAKIVNALSIVLSIALAVGTGWLIWKLTEQEIKKTEGVGDEEDQLARDALSTAADELESPLVRSFSLDRYRDEPLEDATVPLVGSPRQSQSPHRRTR